MSTRGPDFHKKEAKRSLWDNDGEHVPHKYRKKGRGRSKDKKLIRDETKEIDSGSTVHISTRE